MYFPVAFLCCISLVLGVATATCLFSLSSDFVNNNPIILLNGDILNPNNPAGNVSLRDNQTIQLLCSGPRNYLMMSKTFERVVEATCFNGQFHLTNNSTENYRIQDIKCKLVPQADIRDVGPCNYNFRNLQIGFMVNVTTFLGKIDVCFNPNNLTTYWTRHVLHMCEYSCQLAPSTTFRRDFFNAANVNRIYRNSGYDKGHLSPRCDFFSGAEKRMTFFYVNTSPQVRNFNQQNWKKLEAVIRTAAKRADKRLYVYTGSTKHVRDLEKTIPVSLYFWKVIIDSWSGNGVAFVGVNNVDSDVNSPCTTTPCKKLNWLSDFIPQMSNVTRGKIYCASIESLKYVPNIILPDFDEYTGDLLTKM
ncbi:hypothetical protein MTP99_018663 [Tenebrio molitor]|jgi:hypothetical protein|nr:hypothetical protein MTP99_018663 [Tenebrio molitor]